MVKTKANILFTQRM